MKHKIILPEEQTRTAWSGGTTTQLFIYPEDASYALRNFGFRLSTATVEIPVSDFTALPGFARKLMLISGTIVISHNNEPGKQLHPYETETFMGHWQTKAVGTCTDFNLIHSPLFHTTLFTYSPENIEKYLYTQSNNIDWVFIYNSGNTINIQLNEKSIELPHHALLMIEQCDISQIKIENPFETSLIMGSIQAEK